MNSKLIGGILLVIGTTIGAGILALPVATAQLGFWNSLVMLVACWGVMTICASLFLEVNLWLPPNTNLVSMVGMTLGKTGQVITWIFYLLLLYSILSAYIAGGGDLLHFLFASAGVHLPLTLAFILFTVLFGLIVSRGMRTVDYVNRGLMSGKMGAYLLLVLAICPFISMQNLDVGQISETSVPSGLMVAMIAFGSLMIIPSLRTYFNGDIKSLRKAIFIGLFIPLICYVVWNLVIQGVIPLNGAFGLEAISQSSSSNSDVISALNVILGKEIITTIAKFFTSICMVTSFLSISLCLSDFLADGMNLKKQGTSSIIIYGVTFLPPLLVVLINNHAFLEGLQFAGVSCVILMILFPSLMVWRGRYYQGLLAKQYPQVKGGKILLTILIILSIVMLICWANDFFHLNYF